MAVEKPLRFDQVQDYGYRPKNLLTNGGFEVWQRGTAFSGPAGKYVADEWLCTAPGAGSWSVSRSTDAKVSQYSLYGIGTGGGTVSIQAGLENWKSLEGLTLTASVWIKGSGPVSIGMADYNGSWESGTLGLLTQFGVWQRITAIKTIRTGLVYPGAASPPHGWPIFIQIGAGVNHSMYVDGATCVIGNFPEGVPFHPLTPHEDLARCQRYYQSFKNFSMSAYMIATTGSYIFTMPFPVPMPTGAVLTPVKTAEVLSGVTTSGSIAVNNGYCQSYLFTILNGSGSPGMGGVNWDFNLALP